MILKSPVLFPLFRNARDIVSGVSSRLVLKRVRSNKVFVVFSPSIYDRWAKEFESIISCNICNVYKRSWKGEPTLHDLHDCINTIEYFRPDLIIAIGGGSTLDGAKLAWAFYEHPHLKNRTIDNPLYIPDLRGLSKFIAIPTTIGSGSEVSSSAVYTHTDNGSKLAAITHDFLPDLVIYDPELLDKVPTPILLSSLGDALTHVIEGYTSEINNPMMDYFAITALQLISTVIQKISDGDLSSETILQGQFGSMMGGWIQNHCLVGVCHAISHQLYNYGFSHSIANTILMPSVLEVQSHSDFLSAKYKKLYNDAFHQNLSSIQAVENLANLFHSLSKTIELPHPNILPKAFDISEKAKIDPSAKYNALPIDEPLIEKILSHASRR